MKTQKLISLDVEVAKKLKEFNNASSLINKLLMEDFGMIKKKCPNCEKHQIVKEKMQEQIFKLDEEISKLKNGSRKG